MVIINGEAVQAEGQTLLAYLSGQGCNMQRIAVECNGEIVPKAQYEETILKDGDTLEVVSFVGGG